MIRNIPNPFEPLLKHERTKGRAGNEERNIALLGDEGKVKKLRKGRRGPEDYRRGRRGEREGECEGKGKGEKNGKGRKD